MKSSFLLYFFKNIAINMKIFDSQQRAKSVFSLVYNMVVYSCFGILIRWNNIDLEDWTTASLSCGPAYVKKAQWGNILSRFDDNIFMDWPLANLPRSDPTKMQYYVASITNRKNNIKIKETFFFTQEDINKTKISFQKWFCPIVDWIHLTSWLQKSERTEGAKEAYLIPWVIILWSFRRSKIAPLQYKYKSLFFSVSGLSG